MYSDGSSHESCGAAWSGTSGAAKDDDDDADGISAGCEVMYDDDDDESGALELVLCIILPLAMRQHQLTAQLSEIVLREYIFGSKKLLLAHSEQYLSMSSATAARGVKSLPTRVGTTTEIGARMTSVRRVMDHLPTSAFVRAEMLPLFRDRIAGLHAAHVMTSIASKRAVAN